MRPYAFLFLPPEAPQPDVSQSDAAGRALSVVMSSRSASIERESPSEVAMTFVGVDQDHQVVGDRAYWVLAAAGEFGISLHSIPQTPIMGASAQAPYKRRSPAFPASAVRLPHQLDHLQIDD
jgi:hypothetical protein